MASDLQAIGVPHAARDLRIDAPGEWSIVDLDDIKLADLVLPRLKTLRRPVTDRAHEAVRLLRAGPNETRRPEYLCELMMRASPPQNVA